MCACSCRSLRIMPLLLLAFLLTGALPVRALPALDRPSGIDADDDWLHFGYDSAFTGNNPSETIIGKDNVGQLRLRWGLGCNDGRFSVVFRSPAVRNGLLYNSSAGSHLTAYNARSGHVLWAFSKDLSELNGWASQPAVSTDGVVIYPWENDPTYLFAVDGQTGAQIWESAVTFDVGFSGAARLVPTIDETNDVVYILEEPFIGDGKLWAINMANGQVAWWMGKPLYDASFVGSYALLSGGKVYAAADVPITPSPYRGESMLRIDPLTQTIETTYERPTPENNWQLTQYTICGDTLVVGFDYQYEPEKQLVAYDLDAPTIVWQKAISAITGAIACDPAAGQIYVPTNPYLYALDVADGSEDWKHLGYDEIYSPSIANGVVYYLSDTNLYALDQASGTQLFHFPLGYEADETTQVAIADGWLYFSGNGGTCDLYALSLPGPPKVFLPVVLRNW